MIAEVATVAAGGLLFLAARGVARALDRRASFERTLERHHPELRRAFPEHGPELGLVAARAVGVRTPAMPRQLGPGWELP